MTGRSLGGLLVIAAICVAMLWSSQPQSQVAGQPGPKAQKWEYKLVPAQELSEKRLNELGAEAWDYSGIPGPNALFKRPKQ